MDTIQIVKTDTDELCAKIGKNTVDFMSRQTKLDDEAKSVIIDEAQKILNKCIRPGKSGDITNIAVGYVQSGKTLSFTTLTALAADNGYRIVIYLTGTKTNLQEQTAGRLKEDLDIDSSDTYRLYGSIGNKLNAVNNIRNFIIGTDTVLLFPILKHYKHINALAEVFESLKPELASLGAIIIDDEADQSSFNTYAKKNASNDGEWTDDEFSKTYSSILALKKSLVSHSYIQYTATPQAAFLIDNNDILSPKYHVVLTPGKGYTGGKYFFKEHKEQLICPIPEDEIYNEKSNPLVEMPASLKEALREFLISVSIMVFIKKKMNYLSMMVHIDGKCSSNEKFETWISQHLQDWFDFLGAAEGDPAKEQTLKEFSNSYKNITKFMDNAPAFSEVEKVLKKSIIYSQVYLIQGDANKTVDWKTNKGNILVGAEMLNRGFTINNLSMTYMPRTTKGKATADTIEQRCRFFGYKSSYASICRVFLSQKNIQDYVDYVEHEEVLRDNLKQCTTLEEMAKRPSSMLLANSLNPTRTNILTSKLVHSKLSGWKQMRSLEDYVLNKQKTIAFLRSWEDSQYTNFKDYSNYKRNHRYLKCPIDYFLKYLKSIKYGDVPTITRKIVTLQYLTYLKEFKHIDFVYVIEIAYAAETYSDLRTRRLDKSGYKPINLQAGYAANASYEGDEFFKFEDSVCVQFHHIKITQPLSMYNNADVYNLAFYYPTSLAKDFVGFEEEEDQNE